MFNSIVSLILIVLSEVETVFNSIVSLITDCTFRGGDCV